MADMEVGGSHYSVNYALKQESKTQVAPPQPVDKRASVLQLDNLIELTKSAHENTYNESKIASIKQQILDGTYTLNLNTLVEELMVELMTGEHV